MAHNMLKYAQIHLKYTPKHPKPTLEQIWSADSTSYIAQKHLKTRFWRFPPYKGVFPLLLNCTLLFELHNGSYHTQWYSIQLKHTPKHSKNTLEQIWTAGSTSYTAQKHLKTRFWRFPPYKGVLSVTFVGLSVTFWAAQWPITYTMILNTAQTHPKTLPKHSRTNLNSR
jgi:hypothetical protein